MSRVRAIMRFKVVLVILTAAAAVRCEETPTEVSGPYVPPAVKGEDGRRLLWKPRGSYENPEEYQCYEPDFSREGNKAVVSYRNGQWGRDGRIAILDLSTRELKEIVVGNSGVRPDWSPTGDWIAYQSNKESKPYIWLTRPDGTENHRLEFEWAYRPNWGPDGRRLYFLLDSTDHLRLDAVYYDFPEEKLVRLHHSEEYGHRSVVPSPGGEYVALNLFNDRKTRTDVVLAFIRTDRRGFTVSWPGVPGAVGWPVDWAPGGTFVIVSYYQPLSHGQELWTYEVKSAAVRQLTMRPLDKKLDYCYYGASWGPNGDIVLATNQGWLYLIKAPE